SGPIALAAYLSGQLAEGRFDYAKAMRQYKKAAALEEDNPEYLLAAGRMACTLADYDRAQEWLTKMPNGMTDDQVFNFINLSIRLLHDTGKYREMCILMIFDMQVRSLFGKLDWGTGLNNILLIAIYIQPEELNLFISHFEFFEIMKASQLFKKSINKVFEDEEFVVYLKNENFKEAVSVLRSYLGVMEKTLGQDHPEIALLYSSFAFFYLSQGDYKKAAPLIQRALHIKEKTLGKNHPSVAITLNNLALMHILQEHYDEAESLYQRSLNIVSKSFGNDHPQVAAALNNLAELYKIQGRDEEANSLHQRAAAIQKAGNDKKTTALFQHIIKILSNNFDQARYDDLIKHEMAEQ
ncbi:MAG: tetratricopeptide repeat protein, partial [Candidatus Electrothrix sp. AUS3]|nr:tetratricopeptide repeat protein [Candidatus Electrothrix gigas]